MYIDSQETFSDDQSVAGTGAITSTNVYDTGAPADVGIGERMYLFASVTDDIEGGDSIQVNLQTSDAVGGTYATVASGAVVPVDSEDGLPAGTRIAAIPLPIGLKRFLRVSYTVAGTNTGGTVHASLVKDVDAQQYLTSGIPAF